jgi:alpha-D-ribose 1-methylphosphonate 5-triphosphate synthase subunit PhnG
MAVCAGATRAELASALGTLSHAIEVSDLRPAESGLVMLRGRMGGDGRAFNVGEASVTRAAVQLGDGRKGVAYQLGRDRDKARMAAILDALWQGRERTAVETAIASVRRRLEARSAERTRRAAATKVNFFTMVRGED